MYFLYPFDISCRLFSFCRSTLPELDHPPMTARRMISLLSGLIALVAAGGFTAHTQMQPPTSGSRPGDTAARISRGAKSPTETIDPNGCGRCHSAEVAGFALSAMSHSMRPGAEEPSGKVQVPGTTITISSSAGRIIAALGER